VSNKEKPIIEIDTSKLTNTLIQFRVDAYTKALWQFKLSDYQKRFIKETLTKMIKDYEKIPEVIHVNGKYNITINAVIPTEEKEGQNDIELLTKELDITKRKLKLCDEEVDTLKKENKKVKECEDKLEEYEKKLKEIERQIALHRQGVVTDPKQVINSIIKILSQA
jgi:DNA/RNA-binding domain of Phe-tRNA-synthetase-like protein